MNTSSSARQKKIKEATAAFPYPELGAYAPGPGASAQAAEEEQKRREASAWEAGRREGEARALAQPAAQLEEIRGGMAAALEQFARERREYYLHVEREVVQLALTIARKILHRESVVDPLLLAGMVRVQLERIDQSTKTVLRVHPQQVSEFRSFFARQLSEKQPDVIEDASLEPDRCVLQTALGTTEIGPEVQLKEIEQGLLDLEAARPHIRS
jgi:flagellar assembly protein FliH